MSDELAPLDTGHLDTRSDLREEHQIRAAKIMEMRRAATTFEEIGKAVGVSRQRAHQIYRKTLAEIPVEQVSLHRQEQADLLDGLKEKALEVLAKKHITVSNGRVVQLPDADGNLVPLEDDGPTLDAIRTVLAIEERRAKLLGLDTPVKQLIEGSQTITYAFEGVNLGALR